MKILTAAQLKAADQYTIVNEPIASIQLMERAGVALFKAIQQKYPNQHSFTVFCGPGNNGGDGLVLARLFQENNCTVVVVILKGKYSEEFKINFEKIKNLPVEFLEIENESILENLTLNASSCFIDALFGIGVSRPLEGLGAMLVRKINATKNLKIAVDMPSGLSPDAQFSSTADNTLLANCTLTIQLPKLSFFFTENKKFTGMVEIIDIGLSKEFIKKSPTANFFVTAKEIEDIIQPRSVVGHKGTFGNALLIAGSEGKLGTAILASKAALRSGCGLITAAVPKTGIIPLLCTLPEAMILNRDVEGLFLKTDFTKFDAIGIGPGIGFSEASVTMLHHLLINYKGTIVLDADAITILSKNKEWCSQLNSNIVLTPHPGEFDRLTKNHASGLERFKTQQEFSKTYQVNILLKGPNTSITTPTGSCFFNSTGNHGMATAGSGDVLTGIITSLGAQGYPIAYAAIVGAFLHGFAGDTAALRYSKTSMIASDIIGCIPDFFKLFER